MWHYQPPQFYGELCATMLAFLTIIITLFRIITCGLRETGIELFQSVEETFDTEICSHESLTRYINELSYWKLGQFEKFCHSKEDKKGSHFCSKIFKRFYSLEDSYKKDTEMKTLVPRVKRETFEKEEDYIEVFVTDIMYELKVQYVVIMLDESQVTSERKKILKNIFKSFSKHGIRLSVEILGKMSQNITKLVPITSADRPCMFYLMGDSFQIMQQVRLWIL